MHPAVTSFNNFNGMEQDKMKLFSILFLALITLSGCVTTQGPSQSSNTQNSSGNTQNSSNVSTQISNGSGQSGKQGRPGLDNNKIAELKKEIGYGQASIQANGRRSSKPTAHEKRQILYGTVITTDRDSVHVNPDKNSSGLITVHMIDSGLSSDDVKQFPRGTRVKISRVDGKSEPWSHIEKVTGKEAKVKIANRSECLQHYGTDGATMCFKKFSK